MVHASVFSGIGGPEVAAAMLGWENAFHCDINPFGVRVLNYWFPKAESYGDVKKQSFTKWGGRIDVLTGGFPCQPFSNAGKRGGANDYRYLWPEMFRVIQEVRPTWFVGENVDGLTTMVEPGSVVEMGNETSLFGETDGVYRYESRDPFTIERICRDLESARYDVQPIIVPACAVGAPHRRDRVFILAYNTDCGDGCTKSGNAGSTQGTEGVQERNDLRQSRKSDTVRSEVCEALENSLRVGCNADRRKSKGVSGTSGTLAQEIVSGYVRNRGLILPTPTAKEGTHGTNTYNPNSQMGQSLSAMAGSGLLPTPMARDYKNPSNADGDRIKRKVEQGYTIELNDLIPAITAEGMLPTPAARDWKGCTNPGVKKEKSGCTYGELLPDTISRLTKDSCPKTGGQTSRLSPLFTQEMMGFPLIYLIWPFLSRNGETEQSKPAETP